MAINSEFLSKIDHECVGIIWITPDSLNSKLTHYNEIDYLLDGPLERESKNHSNVPHLFSSMSFGHPFIVGHLVLGMKDFRQKIEDFLQIMAGIAVQSPKVFILTNDKTSLMEIEKLASKFPALAIKSL